MAVVSFKTKKKGDSFFTEHKRQEIVKKKSANQTVKEILTSASLDQLKELGQKYGVKLKPKLEKGLFESYIKEPSKSEYVEKLSEVVSLEDLKKSQNILAKQKKKRRQSENPW